MANIQSPGDGGNQAYCGDGASFFGLTSYQQYAANYFREQAASNLNSSSLDVLRQFPNLTIENVCGIPGDNNAVKGEKPAPQKATDLNAAPQPKQTELNAAPQSKPTELNAAPQGKAMDLNAAPQGKATDLNAAPQSKPTELNAAPQGKATDLNAAPQTKTTDLNAVPRTDKGDKIDTTGMNAQVADDKKGSDTKTSKPIDLTPTPITDNRIPMKAPEPPPPVKTPEAPVMKPMLVEKTRGAFLSPTESLDHREIPKLIAQLISDNSNDVKEARRKIAVFSETFQPHLEEAAKSKNTKLANEAKDLLKEFKHKKAVDAIARFTERSEPKTFGIGGDEAKAFVDNLEQKLPAWERDALGGDKAVAKELLEMALTRDTEGFKKRLEKLDSGGRGRAEFAINRLTKSIDLEFNLYGDRWGFQYRRKD